MTNLVKSEPTLAQSEKEKTEKLPTKSVQDSKAFAELSRKVDRLSNALQIETKKSVALEQELRKLEANEEKKLALEQQQQNWATQRENVRKEAEVKFKDRWAKSFEQFN